MDPKTVPYEIARRYLLDNVGWLDPEMYDRALGWVRSRNLKGLATFSSTLSDHHRTDRSVVTFARQLEAFFKKNALYSEPEVCFNAAKASFMQAEATCRITNKRLDHYFLQRERLAPDLKLWTSRMEVYISRVLGDFDPFFEELPTRVRVTSGATASRSRRDSLPSLKISKKVRCTPGAAPYVQAMFKYFGYGNVRCLTGVVNRIEVVRKNWKTDRTIACEPDGNLPFQLAFDGYAKERLRLFGINLRSQKANQEAARRGSIDGKTATVDLKQASDTSAYNAVAWFFPEPWFRYLCAFRCPLGYEGKFGLIPYAKFSSMGNGATFTIETLLFAAACYAVGSKDFNVYGDDVTIESHLVDKLLRCLSFVGFKVNPDKSYTAGPFRESCGTDWFEGTNVTPFYLRNWGKGKSLTSHNVNGLASIALPYGQLWEFLSALISEKNLPLVPWNDNSMSGVFITPHHAYQQKKISQIDPETGRPGWVLRFKGYQPKKSTLTIADTRSLFLWYLDKYRRRLPETDAFVTAVDIRSSYSIPDLGNRQRWTHWILPVAAIPDHAYVWSDFILRNKS